MKIKVGSDFSGVGAFDQALQRLNIDYETIFACDMDKYARQVYSLVYGEPKYYPDNVYNREIPTEPLDIYMTSPPCQSFSLSGKRLGKEDVRGILFFNSLEFIRENKPRFFIFENVKGLLSHDKTNKKATYGKTFSEWINFLGGKSINGNATMMPFEDSVPYHIYFQVLNAKEHGVPQNRERIFIVGIRDDKDNNFRFPAKEVLKLRLKDVLEPIVDEKYFLSEKMIENIYTPANKEKWQSGKMIIDRDIATTISATCHKMHRADTDNYVSDNIIKIGFINQDTQASQVYSDKRVSLNICAGAKGYANGYVENTDEVIQLNPSKESNGVQPFQQNRVYDVNGCGGLGAKTGLYEVDGKIVKSNFNDKRLNETIEINNLKIDDTKMLDTYNRAINDISPTLIDPKHNNIRLLNQKRIRRLTPTEVFRLMDFDESFMDKIKAHNEANPKQSISDSQLYKMGGNSIVVACLEKIIKNLKFEDEKL